MLSPEEERVFRKGVTRSPFSESHGWSRAHEEYNNRVGVLLRNHIAELRKLRTLRGGKLSGPQAENFLEGIKKNGFGDRRVHAFNQSVLRKLRLIALGGIVAAGLGQFENLRKFDQNAALKRYYMTAKRALQEGDWQTADRAIRGGGGVGSGANNLSNELVGLGYYREAAILEERRKQRVNDFRAVQDGHSVRGVPNKFEDFPAG